MAFAGIYCLLLAGLCLIVSFICFIIVLVKMFQNGQSTLGIMCIVLTPCAGIGKLIAFIVGWMNDKAWKIQRLMLVWTVCYIGIILFCVVGIILSYIGAPDPADEFFHQKSVQNM